VTVVETILVYAVAPLAVVAVLALLTLVPGRPKKARYKPGQPWEHEPVWYEPHPAAGGGHGPTAAHGPAAVPGDGTTALGSSMYPEQHGERNTGQPGAPTAPHVGDGARGSHGATALGAGATPALGAGPSAAAAARPLGGARGTW
jgi:hypothetical protein